MACAPTPINYSPASPVWTSAHLSCPVLLKELTRAGISQPAGQMSGRNRISSILSTRRFRVTLTSLSGSKTLCRRTCIPKRDSWLVRLWRPAVDTCFLWFFQIMSHGTTTWELMSCSSDPSREATARRFIPQSVRRLRQNFPLPIRIPGCGFSGRENGLLPTSQRMEKTGRCMRRTL